MLIDEKKETEIRFMTVAKPEVYIAVNEFGDIDTVFRYFSMTVKNIIARFGEQQVSDASRITADFRVIVPNALVNRSINCYNLGFEIKLKIAW